ncbi:serine/threonine-protein kinase Kist-like [Lingula anatina]|uniref:Serine/threonine-protein kinase Kist-like n=1 Tax=Lingula anatina TaxID=7574 RepID=A0A1S3K907_LINAN|nr:serine/threonine-protein kinase Kist-like [Lingula anatina]|eukprot:XP_013419103.1 serine/threonine-protein kinase Kist-like [Lingula anatina]
MENHAVQGTEGRVWHVKNKIGEGSCCSVYRAVEAVGFGEVCIKVYRADSRYVFACDRERILLDILHTKHPSNQHIVNVLDYCILDNNQHCLVQEQLDLDIRQLLLKSSGRLSLYHIQRLARDIYHGLWCLHSLGFVHGDVKPTNILWSGQSGCWKLIDLGLSFHTEDKDVGQIQTSGYRAPESTLWNETAEENRHQVSAPGCEADMWSVGCVMLEAFTGEKFLKKGDTVAVCEICKSTAPKYTQCRYYARACQTITSSKTEEHSDEKVFKAFSNMICSLVTCLPKNRAKAECANLPQDHFLDYSIAPTYHDLLLLPTCVLRLLNVLDEGEDEDEDRDEERYKDIQTDVLSECEKYGHVVKCVIPKEGPGRGKVYVEFSQCRDCEVAFSSLCGRTFSGRTVITTFFPQDWMESGRLL